MEELHCIGCGAQLQSSEPAEIGYTPVAVLAQENDQDVYCKRCFRLRHYNEIQDVDLTDDDFLRLLQEIGNHEALIVNVVDIFDFSGSLISGLHRFAQHNPVLLVGNKADVLPKSLNKNKLINWMRHQANINGLKPIDVLLTSAKKAHDVDELLAEINEYRAGHDVYVVGVTNVGKSTLINTIIKSTAGIKDLITTSRFPGTTLDKIEIPFSDGTKLFDTPGIINAGQMAHFLAPQDLKKITPKNEIKPKIYQLNPEQTLFFGGLARFDFIAGNRQSFTIYLSNEIEIHRTKLANADDFYDRHQADQLLTPKFNRDLKLKRFEFSIKKPTDLVFAGLGWVSIKKEARVAGYVPSGVELLLREPLI